MVSIYLHSNFSGGLRNNYFISAGVTFQPFKVIELIEGHWIGHQSKARMRLPISPSK